MSYKYTSPLRNNILIYRYSNCFIDPYEKERKKLLLERGSLLLEEMITSCIDKCRCNPIRSISAREVLEATNNFDSHLHDSFYYKWYKCTLDDRPVLLKKYERDFENIACRDIVISSQMSSHKNVLKLLGCCLEFSGPILVYEYAPYGTLNSIVPSLSWKMRLKTAKDIANVITYLHVAFPRPIIYRDMDPSNIFLDKDFAPKLCNFGFSISIPEGESHVEDIVIGCFGFAEPDYVRTGFITEHIDVYSLGVFLLALLTGQKAFDKSRPEGNEIIGKYVSYLLKDEQFSEIVDPKISEEDGGIYIEEKQLQLAAFLKLALRCIEDRREDRPQMIDVAKELVKIERSTSLKFF